MRKGSELYNSRRFVLIDGAMNVELMTDEKCEEIKREALRSIRENHAEVFTGMTKGEIAKLQWHEVLSLYHHEITMLERRVRDCTRNHFVRLITDDSTL